jgi:hypothetical protein
VLDQLNDEGRTLAVRLQRALGSNALVEYQPIAVDDE